MYILLGNAKTIIFDVDGLMIDSEPIWHNAREVYFEQKGLTYSGELDVRGRGIKDIINLWKEHFGLIGDTDALAEEFRSTFYDLALSSHQLQLMIGITELVQRLFDAGKILAVATGGHTKEKMQHILRIFNLEKYFSVIVSADEVKKGKPAPDIFLHTAALLHAQPQECVVLEDAVNGVLAAQTAGIPVIAVQSDSKIYAKLHELQPNVLVKSLEELL